VRGARVLVLLHRVMEHTLAVSARRQASASLGVSQDVVSFLLETDLAMDMLLAHHAQRKARGLAMEGNADNTRHSNDPANSGDVALDACTTPPASPPLATAPSLGTVGTTSSSGTAGAAVISKSKEHIGQLHDAVGEHIERHMLNSHSWRLLPYAVWRLFLWQTPFGACMVHCIFFSSTTRVILFIVDVTGALMMGTVFFEASGHVHGKARLIRDCGSDDPVEQVGRLVAIGLASLIIAGLPVMVLNSLTTRSIKEFDYRGCPGWRRQLQIWRTQDRLIWVIAFLYVGFCAFFISIFFANVAAEDQKGWIISGLVSVVLDTLIIPLSIALVVPLLCTLCLVVVSLVDKVSKQELVRQRHTELQAEHANLTLPMVFI